MSFAMFISLSAFAAAAATIWLTATAFARRPDRTVERLTSLWEPSEEARRYLTNDEILSLAIRRESAATAPVAPAVSPLSSELENDPVRLLLANAGFFSPHAPKVLAAARTAAGVAGLLTGGIAGLVIFGMSREAALCPVIFGSLGFFAPVVALRLLKATRQQRIFASVPDVLDMVVVCMEAGLGFDDALRSVTEQFSDSAPDMCRELRMYGLQLQLGRPRRDALSEMAARIGLDEVKSLTTVLVQSERMGSPIVRALRTESHHMRIKRRLRAEELAGKAAAKIIFPLVLFIFPGIFVVLVGPAMPDLARMMRPAGSARPETAQVSRN